MLQKTNSVESLRDSTIRRRDSVRHTEPVKYRQVYRVFRAFEGFVWFSLGILIFVWLIFPIKQLEFVLWFGFGIGCTLTGIFTMHHSISLN